MDVKQEPTPRPLGTLVIKPEPIDQDLPSRFRLYFLCSFGAIHRVLLSVFTYTFSDTQVHGDSLFCHASYACTSVYSVHAIS